MEHMPDMDHDRYFENLRKWGRMALLVDNELKACVEARIMPLSSSPVPSVALAEWQFRGRIHDGLNQTGDCDLCGKAAEYLFEIIRTAPNGDVSFRIDISCLSRLESICLFNDYDRKVVRFDERERELSRSLMFYKAFQPMLRLADLLDNRRDRELWCHVVQVVHETRKAGTLPPTELAMIMNMMAKRGIEYAPEAYSSLLAVNSDWDELKSMDETLLESLLPAMSEDARRRLRHERANIIPF